MKLRKALAGLLLAGSLLLVQSNQQPPTKKEYYYMPIFAQTQPNTVCIEVSRFKDKDEEVSKRAKDVDEIFKYVLTKTEKIKYKILENYKDKYTLNAKEVEERFKEGSCFEKSALALQFLRENGYDANMAAVKIIKNSKDNSYLIEDKHAIVLLYLGGKRYILDPTCKVFFERGEDYLDYWKEVNPSVYEICIYPFEKVEKPVKMSVLEELKSERKWANKAEVYR